MNEIVTITESFAGTPVTLHQRDEDLWFTAREGATALEMRDQREFLRLVRDHSDEILPEEVTVGLLPTVDGKRRKVKLFRLSVLDLVGPCTKSERGRIVRRWTADIRHRFRTGRSAEITREQFQQMKAERDELVALVKSCQAENKALRDELTTQHRTFMATVAEFVGSNKIIASLAGEILNARKAQKAIEEEAADTRQLRLWKPWNEVARADAGGAAS